MDVVDGIGLESSGKGHRLLELRTKKDRIQNALLILLFLAIMGGAAYFIFKEMTHWNVKGLG